MRDDNQKLADRILELKKRRNAIILAHNYQASEVQDIADFVGDSLELSRIAASTQADLIVFCGVRFMAETASILCPDKQVLLPDKDAGCPMADMITGEQLRLKRQELPGYAVVCYINSSAEVKAESDYCCTSANAVRIVNSIDADKILFIPDQYLGSYVASQSGKDIVLWPGYCPTHARINIESILETKRDYPDAVVLAHPECRTEIVRMSDEILSTGGMLRFAKTTDAPNMIMATEVGILHRLRQENPLKNFIPASEQAICPNMKRINLEKILWSLEDRQFEIRVPEPIRIKAKQAVDRMLKAGTSP